MRLACRASCGIRRWWLWSGVRRVLCAPRGPARLLWHARENREDVRIDNWWRNGRRRHCLPSWLGIACRVVSLGTGGDVSRFRGQVLYYIVIGDALSITGRPLLQQRLRGYDGTSSRSSLGERYISFEPRSRVFPRSRSVARRPMALSTARAEEASQRFWRRMADHECTYTHELPVPRLSPR